MSPRKLAPYVIRTLARYQTEGRVANLQVLVDEIGVRKVDVRKTVSALHREGYVDALRMRLTMAGFALGAALSKVELPPLRMASMAVAAA
jgi:Mn-dependent DtxR family transcriptional regulator